MTKLWPTLSDDVQTRAIDALMDTQGDDYTLDDARADLSSIDDETLRDHLREGIGYVLEDEHDRIVNTTWAAWSRDYEAKQDASFQDAAHVFSLCQELIAHELGRYDGTQGHGMSPHYEARLRMSHARLTEMLLQRGCEDMEPMSDGYLTRMIDVITRG